MEKAPKNRLFGTDGIRKKVGDFPLDDDSIVKLGHAIGVFSGGAKIVIGRDTRASGQSIARLMAAGISSAAIVSRQSEVYDCGIIPTPGVSFVTEHGDFDYGIMITASHNPYTDNGIKIFTAEGEKIPETMEAQLESIFFQLETPGYSLAPLIQYGEGLNRYRHFLSTQTSGLTGESLGSKLKVVLDCANGATYEIAPQVFREAGIETKTVHVEPDGKNINRQCGSMHIEKIGKTAKVENAHLGIAFDGDGDRVLFVDNKGRSIQGDHALYLISKYLLRTREDFNKIVVGTVMGNLGLEKAFEQIGIRYIRTPVGDKYVYREMTRQESILGGEQSGHTILRYLQKTGDGILTALVFLKALAVLEIDPADAFDQLRLYPQVIENITIREKKDLEGWEQLNEMIRVFEGKYGDNSRLLIRYSGTEPIIRIMMESEHRSIIDENIVKFEHLIKSTIGK